MLPVTLHAPLFITAKLLKAANGNRVGELPFLRRLDGR